MFGTRIARAARIAFVTVLLSVSGSIALGGHAAGYTYKVLYSFCAQPNCVDGEGPMGDLATDTAGNIYGVTFAGGDQNDGTVFKLTANAHDTWSFHRLHSFCGRRHCTDGQTPFGGVIVDVAGNVYGTTYGGVGTAFELSKANHWKVSVLQTFNQPGDGKPFASLTYTGASPGTLYDGTSPLFGAGTSTSSGYGNVFRLKPQAGQTAWEETILHSFADWSAGAIPFNRLLVDHRQRIYGTTAYGGLAGQGTMFELIPNRARTKWTHVVLYSFCHQSNCTDGAMPSASLSLDDQGNLLGTTDHGGNTACPGDSGCGVIYKVVLNGTSSTETALYTFCLQPPCTDGAESIGSGLTSVDVGAVSINSSGALVGAAPYGGTSVNASSHGAGAIWTLDGSNFTVLYNFCSQSNCTDGANPGSPVLIDSAGRIFGVTTWGGAHGAGTIYELTP